MILRKGCAQNVPQPTQLHGPQTPGARVKNHEAHPAIIKKIVTAAEEPAVEPGIGRLLGRERSWLPITVR